MKCKKDTEKIEDALANGLIRLDGEKAPPDQPLTYILSDKKFYHHANLESAKAEKEFLESALGRRMRIYKIWNANREITENDMKLLRTELNNSLDWNKHDEAVDRILNGAGY